MSFLTGKSSQPSLGIVDGTPSYPFGSASIWGNTSSNCLTVDGNLTVRGNITQDQASLVACGSPRPWDITFLDPKGDIAVIISLANGKVTIPKGVKLDKAALAFWEAVYKNFATHWDKRPL